jgi:SAM-dependent methyltransferase
MITRLWRRYIAGQLRKPSGLIGRTIIARRFRQLNGSINESTLSALDLESDDSVLEVGFGPGHLMSAMVPLVPAGSVSGVDFSTDMVAVCAKRLRGAVQDGRVELQCADAASLPYGDARFTKACTVNTIYFWSDPSRPFRELHRVLRDGGRLVVSFSPRATMERVSVAEHGFNLYDPEEVGALLRDAGFTAVEMLPGVGPRGEFLCAVASKQ